MATKSKAPSARPSNGHRPTNADIKAADAAARAMLRRKFRALAADHDDFVSAALLYALEVWDGARSYAALVTWKAEKLALDAKRKAAGDNRPALGRAERFTTEAALRDAVHAECSRRLAEALGCGRLESTLRWADAREMVSRLARSASAILQALDDTPELLPVLAGLEEEPLVLGPRERAFELVGHPLGPRLNRDALAKIAGYRLGLDVTRYGAVVTSHDGARSYGNGSDSERAVISLFGGDFPAEAVRARLREDMASAVAADGADRGMTAAEVIELQAKAVHAERRRRESGSE